MKPAHFCSHRLGLLQQLRNMADVQAKMWEPSAPWKGGTITPRPDFTVVDVLLQRMLLTITVADSADIGPVTHYALVQISAAEYEALVEMVGVARVTKLAPLAFDFKTYYKTMRSLADAVGRDTSSWTRT